MFAAPRHRHPAACSPKAPAEGGSVVWGAAASGAWRVGACMMDSSSPNAAGHGRQRSTEAAGYRYLAVTLEGIEPAALRTAADELLDRWKQLSLQIEAGLKTAKSVHENS